MNESKRNRWDLVKMLWVIGIFYLIFISNFFWLWQKAENLLPVFTEETENEESTLDYEIQTDSEEITSHLWAIDTFKDIIVDNISWDKIATEEETLEWRKKFSVLCVDYLDVCKKIEFIWDIEIKNKYIFLASIIQIYDFIETNILGADSLENQLKYINIDPDKNGKRGWANAYSIKINNKTIQSYEEFFDLFSHEIGHVVDLGLIVWKNNTKNTLFTEFGNIVFSLDDLSLLYYWISWKSETIRKDSTTRLDFCSKYWMTDPFEDFAECHTLYLNHNALFVYMAERNDSLRKKYNFFSNIYNKHYLFESSGDVNWIKDNPDTRIWDITKITYSVK